MKKQKIGDICRIDDQDRAAADPLTLNFLESQASLGDSRLQRRLLKELIGKYVALEKRVTDLLRNTLPAPVAEEIKYQGHYAPRPFDCTILFLDIAGFTGLAERMTGEALIDLIDELFQGFDDLIARCRGTKIKTIGDAYMVVFGAPAVYADHAAQAIRAALEILKFLHDFNRRHDHAVQMRAGIHTGRVMAGVVGKERMQFIDTPGVLDRPPEERSGIERQALTAMVNLASAILVIIDASEHCGYPLEDQIRLLHEIEAMVRVPVQAVVNKSDITYFDGYINMSTETGEGVGEVLEALLAYRKRSEEEGQAKPR